MNLNSGLPDSRACLLSHSAIASLPFYFCPLLDIPPAIPALPSLTNLTAWVLNTVLTGNKTSKSRFLPPGVHYALQEDRGVLLESQGENNSQESDVKEVLWDFQASEKF